MKTNQIMKRPLANFTVEQRTKDGMFCATALLKQWNDQDGVVQRKLDNYFASSKTAEFIDTIIKRENLDTPKMVYVKSRASRGNGAGTWMHPLLFIDFAMWINLCSYINSSFKVIDVKIFAAAAATYVLN